MPKTVKFAQFAPTEVKSSFWDKEMLVATVQSGENQVRVSACTRKDVDWVSIREFYKAQNGEFLPGKHGLAIKREDPETLENLIGALQFIKECMV